jgi:hypothetical protein
VFIADHDDALGMPFFSISTNQHSSQRIVGSLLVVQKMQQVSTNQSSPEAYVARRAANI